MPRTGARGGPQTRAKIAEVANRLFVEQGYDAVTVAQVAREAGVSSVTVFNHFPRKEDLFLDRGVEAEELLQAAVRGRAETVDVLESLRDATFRLVDAGHPLSGLNDRSIPFFRTVAGSPALIARAREIGAELQRVLAEELERDERFEGDPLLFGCFFVAGYGAVLAETAVRLVGGEALSTVQADHRARLNRLFAALRSGVGG